MKASNGFDVVCQLAVGERGQSEEPSVQEGASRSSVARWGLSSPSVATTRANCYTSEQERRDALEPWLGHYNEVRPHTACDNHPPLTKLRAAGYSSAASTPTPGGSSVKNSGSE